MMINKSFIQNTIFKTIISALAIGCISTNIYAGAPAAGKGVELTQEELEKRIGRMGEVDAIPEGFEFSVAENRIWRTNHLENVTKPMRLYYEFEKTGTYEEGFSDAVYLDIVNINDDGTKDARMQFFTGERQQQISADNVKNVMGNPVIGTYMQGDVYEMNRLTEGHWRHFQKSIKVALRQVTEYEDIEVEYNGKKVKAQKMTFQPYLNDPHRGDFEEFAEKIYEFTFSKEVPGDLYQIRTVINDKKDPSKAPVMEEVLTLIDVKKKS